MFSLVQNAMKETTQLLKTKKHKKKEWNLKNIAQDAINTQFTKKQNNFTNNAKLYT